MIANQPQQPAYLSALLPSDQVFDDDPDDVEMAPPVTSKAVKMKKEVQIKDDFDENEEQENDDEEEVVNGDESEIKQEELIDNPFLRPVKYPSVP